MIYGTTSIGNTKSSLHYRTIQYMYMYMYMYVEKIISCKNNLEAM